MVRGLEGKTKTMNSTSSNTKLVAGFRKMSTIHWNERTLKRTQRTGQ